MYKKDSNNNDKYLTTDIKYRFMRLLIFVIFTLLFLKYLSGLNLNDFACIEITIATSICFMFVDTFYPNVMIKK
jgi:hypothetical protein